MNSIEILNLFVLLCGFVGRISCQLDFDGKDNVIKSKSNLVERIKFSLQQNPTTPGNKNETFLNPQTHLRASTTGNGNSNGIRTSKFQPRFLGPYSSKEKHFLSSVDTRDDSKPTRHLFLTDYDDDVDDRRKIQVQTFQSRHLPDFNRALGAISAQILDTISSNQEYIPYPPNGDPTNYPPYHGVSGRRPKGPVYHASGVYHGLVPDPTSARAGRKGNSKWSECYTDRYPVPAFVSADDFREFVRVAKNRETVEEVGLRAAERQWKNSQSPIKKRAV